MSVDEIPRRPTTARPVRRRIEKPTAREPSCLCDRMLRVERPVGGAGAESVDACTPAVTLPDSVIGVFDNPLDSAFVVIARAPGCAHLERRARSDGWVMHRDGP